MEIRYKERRYYRDPEIHALKLTAKEENIYYHPIRRCILLKHSCLDSRMLEMPADVGYALVPIHKSHVFDNFGICV